MRTLSLIFLLLAGLPLISPAQPYHVGAMGSSSSGRAPAGLGSGPVSPYTPAAMNSLPSQQSSAYVHAANTSGATEKVSLSQQAVPATREMNGLQYKETGLHAAAMYAETSGNRASGQAYEPGKHYSKKHSANGVPATALIPGKYYNCDLQICRRGGFYGLYGVQVAIYNDLSRCRKDMRRLEKKYKIVACVLQDVKDDPFCYRLILGRYRHLRPAWNLLHRLWYNFPGSLIVRFPY